MSGGPELHIEHDHGHLNALLSDLDAAVSAWAKGELPRDGMSPLEAAREAMVLLKEDTYEHFEREEHGLFPNLKADYPELTADLDGLQAGHDEICGCLERLERLLTESTEETPVQTRLSMVDGARQLAALCSKHTADEWMIIRNLLARLDEERRAVILKQYREI